MRQAQSGAEPVEAPGEHRRDDPAAEGVATGAAGMGRDPERSAEAREASEDDDREPSDGARVVTGVGDVSGGGRR